MSTDLPSRPLPAHLASRALPALLAKLRPLSPSHLSFSHSLRGALHALALTRLHEPLRAAPPHSDVPLKLLLEVSQSGPPEILDLATVVDAALAYPTHPAQLSTLWGRAISHDPTLTDTVRTEILPSLIERLRLSPSAGTIRMVTYSLLTLSRAHEELLALLLSEADFIVPALKDAYAALPQVPRNEEEVRAKEGTILLCKAIQDAMGEIAKEGLLRLMGQSIADDLERLGSGTTDQDFVSALKRSRDEAARSDPRLTPLLNLFPTLSPRLLLSALDHPVFASSTSVAGYDAQAAPLIESILSGGSTLPTELIELREEVDHLSREQGGLAAAVPSTSSVLQDGSVSERVRVNGTATGSAPAASYERRNIFDDETLDFSRLRLGKDESTLPQLGNSIPDHLRDSILRLVETQKEEAEAEARAIAEARGGVYLPQTRDDDGDDLDEGTGDGAPSLRTKGGVDGDDSDAEEETGDKIVERRPSLGQSSVNVDIQTTLELAYIADARVFDRDANTRRSNARKQLREETGMDDGQLEGWRVMLERNPHKGAILARHTLVPSRPAREPSEAA
ncbi:hypothetical protein EHS25_001418 [Saitozyma podzolica]|uniref:CUE domain-containing protein n=1 Tax=Saitozyma podzolica TaxID=1890683 RepID=A0A427YFY7_9TREE|nr:hypothetical protein EHS25_001418 [Saitozyma podzolica]